MIPRYKLTWNETPADDVNFVRLPDGPLKEGDVLQGRDVIGLVAENERLESENERLEKELKQALDGLRGA